MKLELDEREVNWIKSLKDASSVKLIIEKLNNKKPLKEILPTLRCKGIVFTLANTSVPKDYEKGEQYI